MTVTRIMITEVIIRIIITAIMEMAMAMLVLLLPVTLNSGDELRQ